MKQLLSLLRWALSIAVHYSSPIFEACSIFKCWQNLHQMMQTSLGWNGSLSRAPFPGWAKISSCGSWYKDFALFFAWDSEVSLVKWLFNVNSVVKSLFGDREWLRNDWGIICNTALCTTRDCNCGTWWSHPQRWRWPVSRSHQWVPLFHHVLYLM